ncbi:hypothetical protein FW778_12985 [Ginsengibacter hankyongi]|uniref:tRNA 2-selenouridine synthase AAA domain-containing protein n=1 Tax=Ginsengibacter hankyongi TaxID=2607284 RepID=A0A5J5IGI4_9BACT|nr:hypothetical protein [Ginsengibacter hankyongi]KAA9038471.1 hypothetical protein FW778_12985 [Ginsengibacter hankyongi]
MFSEGASKPNVSYGTYFFLKGVFYFMHFPASPTFIVLCGKTGSGKSLLIHQLEASGYPVINLEKIASHRGSAFGGLLLPHQPSQKEFENEIEKAFLNHASAKYIFIEQKPSSLGKRKIPAWLYAKINEGIIVHLNIDKQARINNILKEYKAAGKESFIIALHKLERRLTVAVIKEMEALLRAENFEVFIEKMLDYYDNTAKYQLPKKADMVLNGQGEDVAVMKKQLLHALHL